MHKRQDDNDTTLELRESGKFIGLVENVCLIRQRCRTIPTNYTLLRIFFFLYVNDGGYRALTAVLAFTSTALLLHLQHYHKFLTINILNFTKLT